MTQTLKALLTESDIHTSQETDISSPRIPEGRTTVLSADKAQDKVDLQEEE
jgi:hypothetical protein